MKEKKALAHLRAKRNHLFLKLVVPFVLSALSLDVKPPLVSAQETVPVQTRRIYPSDLIYRGAFRLPAGTSGVKTWAWGGYAMTYYSGGDVNGADDGYPGSIYGAGHAWEHQISEINIPVPIISLSKDVNDLNTASTLQSFEDVLNVGDLEIPRTAIAYLPAQGSQTSDKLHIAWGYHMQEEPADQTHAWGELNLSDFRRQGDWHLANLPVYNQNMSTNDYMSDIPRAWATAHTGGRLLATGRYRDGGWGGQGPSLFAIAPWRQGNPPANNAALQHTPLLLYTSTHINPDVHHTMTHYSHADEWSGMVWATAGDKAAVIFVGTKGMGDTWYGNEQGPCLECDNRGWWATGFQAQFVFYDPDDLAMVAAGTKKPYEPQPYATLNVDPYLYHITSDQQKHHLGAACFDRAGGYLYVFEVFADGDEKDTPIVHVWEIAGLTDPEPDIKANGTNGPLSVSHGTPVSITVSLNPGSYAAQHADWWLVEATPSGTYNHYVLGTGSMARGLFPTHQGPLFNLVTTRLLHCSELTIGTHTFYFGVDMNMNGSLDMSSLFHDWVRVHVTKP
ncbi:MAG: hypothetical protein JRL30_20125 [Deltaproteobacteria bacterium]|nr:hypothetical protein [Deltaproteobacteria bacterium]